MSLSHFTLDLGGGGGGDGGGLLRPRPHLLASITFTYNFHFLFLRLINHKGFLSKRRDGRRVGAGAGGRGRAERARLDALLPVLSGTWVVSGPPTLCFIGKILKHK